MSEKNRLLVFDVEGVLIPKRRYLLFEAVNQMGLMVFLRSVIIGILYEVGLLPLESALKSLFRPLKGLIVEDLFHLYRRVPLMPGVKEVFKKLREKGFRIALISSGIPRILVEDLARRLGADYAYGLEIGLDDHGHLTGEIWGEVIKPNGKMIVLRELLKNKKVPPSRCIVIADDRNNLPMFRLCDLSLGYNPDFVLSVKSDLVVTGELSGILPILNEKYSDLRKESLSRKDLIRESIHIGGILVPFLCIYLIDRYVVALLVLITALLYLVSEMARMRGLKVPIFSTVTFKSATNVDLQEFMTAPFFFALGIAFSLIFFPAPLGYASIAILTIGDGSAKIFGKKYGRRRIPFNKGKNFEGTAFGLFFAFLGALLFVDPAKAIVGAAVGMLMESLPLPINDNLIVPLASGAILLAIS